MEELSILIGFTLSVIVIITFFNMSSRLKDMKGELFMIRQMLPEPESASKWVTEYKFAKMKDDKTAMISSLQKYVFTKIRDRNVTDSKNEFDKLKKEYEPLFIELGIAFPEWDKKIFSLH